MLRSKAPLDPSLKGEFGMNSEKEGATKISDPPAACFASYVLSIRPSFSGEIALDAGLGGGREGSAQEFTGLDCLFRKSLLFSPSFLPEDT